MKKKIISVVLVMTMVFALLAVSASADPTPVPIESVTLTGIPEKLSYGDNIGDIGAGIQIPSDANYEKMYVSIGSDETGTINTTGTLNMGVLLKAKEGYYFPTTGTIMNAQYTGALTLPQGVTAQSCTPFSSHNGGHSFNAITSEGAPAPFMAIVFEYTIEAPAATPIESVILTGVPSSLTVGQSVANIKTAITENSNEYGIASVTVLDATPTEVTGTIPAVGNYTLSVLLEAEEGYIFNNETTGPNGADCTVKSDGAQFEVTYTLTATESQVDPDPDSDFDGLFGRLFGFIRWKKFTDDIKTVSILTVIFKLIEAIIAKLAAYIKK